MASAIFVQKVPNGRKGPTFTRVRQVIRLALFIRLTFQVCRCSKTLNKTDQLRSFPLAAGVVHQRVQIVILEATEKVWCLVSYIYRFTEVLAGY